MCTGDALARSEMRQQPPSEEDQVRQLNSHFSQFNDEPQSPHLFIHFSTDNDKDSWKCI